MDLTNDQVTELLTYHRIKRKSQVVCRQCVDEEQVREKTCFVCKRTFTDKYGVRGGKGQPDAQLMSMLKGLANKGKRKDAVKPEDVTDEQKQKWLEAAKKAGIKVLE